MTETTIDGVRYYVKDSGGLIIADVWDKMFKPNLPVQKVSRKFKGDNPDKRKLWMKDKKSY